VRIRKRKNGVQGLRFEKEKGKMNPSRGGDESSLSLQSVKNQKDCRRRQPRIPTLNTDHRLGEFRKYNKHEDEEERKDEKMLCHRTKADFLICRKQRRSGPKRFSLLARRTKGRPQIGWWNRKTQGGKRNKKGNQRARKKSKF